jgi:hypothetical protein
MSDNVLGCTLTLTADDRRTWFEIYNGNLSLIASGSGGLTLSLAAGLYEVHSEQGGPRTVEIVRLEPGLSVERHIEGRAGPVLLPIPNLLAPAQLAHAQAMIQATSGMTHWWTRFGRKARIVVMLRKPTGAGAIPNIAAHARSLSLLDPARRKVHQFNAEWNIGETNGYAITRASVAPGCYTLCTEDSGGRSEQSVVAIPKRQTIVVAPLFPDGPRLGLATLTTCRTDELWLDQSEEHLLLSESSFSRLRRGRPAMTREEVALAIKYIDRDPLLAVIAANALISDYRPSEDRDYVLKDLLLYLNRTIPRHPDVHMLLKIFNRELSPVSYPPMFSDTYAHAVDAQYSDKRAKPFISMGSYAENACAVAFHGEVFLRWPADNRAFPAPSLVLTKGLAASSGTNPFIHSAVQSIFRRSRRQVITQWLTAAIPAALTRRPILSQALTGLMSSNAERRTTDIRRLAAEKVIAYGQQVAALKRGSTALTLTRIDSPELAQGSGVPISISARIRNTIIADLGVEMPDLETPRTITDIGQIELKKEADTDTGGRPKIVIFAAIAVLIAFAGLVAWMLVTARTQNGTVWDRQLYIFTSVEAIVFAAAGALFGVEVKRQQADNAEQRADQASERAAEALNSEKLAATDAERARALAAATRGAITAASQPGTETGRPAGVPGGRGAADGTSTPNAALIALGNIANELFPPT